MNTAQNYIGANVDDIINFGNNELVIIAGLKGSGRTQLALHSLLHGLRDYKRSICYFSAGIDGSTIGKMILSQSAGIDMGSMENGAFSSADMKNLIRHSSELSQMPLFIEDTKNMPIDDIMVKIKKIKESNGINCVFIDSFDLMMLHYDSEEDNKYGVLADKLKYLSHDLSIPIIIIIEINTISGERPCISDLPIGLEKNVDKIVFVHKSSCEPDREIIIAKNRCDKI